MKIYIVLCEDRHTDPWVKVFKNKKRAITYAKEQSLEIGEERKYVKELKVKGWLYCSHIEDVGGVRVEEGELE